jgi:hypothetical protein
MFGFFSFLPFSASDTVYHNGEIFTFILSVKQEDSHIVNTQSLISFNFEVSRDENINL